MLQIIRRLTRATIALSTFAALPAASQIINETQKLTASDGDIDDEFGNSIAVSNGIVAVGAHLNDDNGSNSGSAYLFDASTGAQLYKLLPSDGAPSDIFGYSIAIHNGIVAVGARANDDNGPNSGSAYLFDASTGAQLFKLTAKHGGPSDQFGWSIAINNNIVVVGAFTDFFQGSAGSVYSFNASTGEQIAQFNANDGVPHLSFGQSIDIDNGVVVVGSPGDNENGLNSGAAYLFDAATGVQVAKLLPNDGTELDHFGYSVAIENGVVAVGARYDDNEDYTNSGSAYLFDASTGDQLFKLLPSDIQDRVEFGNSIAIHNDLVVVGAFQGNDNGSDSGSAYIFDATTGDQIAKLLPTDGTSADQFGNSIAIHNDNVVVGAFKDGDNGSRSGSAYVINYLSPTPESFKATAPDGAPNDLFARSIAIDNTTIAVGARGDDDNGSNSGSAYILDASTGEQITKLLPTDGAQGDQFGISTAINSSIAAVGAWRDDDNGSNSGSAYLFDPSTGTQLAKLLPTDGATGDSFGFSVAVNNGSAAVGSFLDDDNGDGSGSAYIFDTTSGAQLLKLLPTDGAPNDQFGYSIAIDNSIIAIGAINANNTAGSAYLFDATTGTQLAKLIPSDGAPDDQFGNSIAINNGIVAVGSYQDDDKGTDSGSAYLFDASTGIQITKLLPRDGSAFDFFGFSISIDNGVVAVGNHRDDFHGTDSGSAYLFDANTGAHLAKLLPTDGAAGDNFGYSIAIDNNIIAAGAWHDDDNGTDSGSIYIFDTNTAPSCPADLTADGQLDFFDISAFLTLFSSGDLAADFTNDTQLDFFDISAFLTAFSAGCP